LETFTLPLIQGSEWRVLVWLRKKTSAERRKMTAFQGIFRSEGTRDGRGQQQCQYPPVAADRSLSNSRGTTWQLILPK